MENFTDNDFPSSLRSRQQQQQHHHHYNHSHRPYHDYANYTIKTSVTIRVTPYEDYFVSWYILWGSFLFVSFVALWQVLKERKIHMQRTQIDDAERSSGLAGDVEGFSTADITRVIVRRSDLSALSERLLSSCPRVAHVLSFLFLVSKTHTTGFAFSRGAVTRADLVPSCLVAVR
jgi:hypothetical protein